MSDTQSPALPPVGDLMLMLAAADRLWCEDTGDEPAAPWYWQGIAERLDRIVRRNQNEGAATAGQ